MLSLKHAHRVEYLTFDCPICGEPKRITRSDYERKKKRCRPGWQPTCSHEHAIEFYGRQKNWRTNS